MDHIFSRVYSWSYNILIMELLKQKLKTKKYQYLYLSAYIGSKYLSLDTFSLREEYERIKFYSNWLNKINEKYNYDGSFE
tara:strand:- start:8 stop:247 length:240 start_codon:yes stop_codon:yes gene_type:complete